MAERHILELLKKEKKVTVPHRKASPRALKTETIFKSLKELKEQIAQVGSVDLSAVLERLTNIENQLVLFNENWQKRVEMYDLQMSILQKFDMVLSKEKNK